MIIRQRILLMTEGKTHIEAKYHKAIQCLAKDRGNLLSCYDFPA